jgi:hypothetical protein
MKDADSIFGIREAIVLGALVLSLIGFIATYNKSLGEQEGKVAALTDQVQRLESRLLSIESKRGCLP